MIRLVPRSKVNRLYSLTIMGLCVFMVLLASNILTGMMIHTELATTYAENHAALVAAGFEDVTQSAKVVSDRVLVLISIVPLLSAALILPILFRMVCIVRSMAKIIESREAVNKDI